MTVSAMERLFVNWPAETGICLFYPACPFVCGCYAAALFPARLFLAKLFLASLLYCLILPGINLC
ncbi:MAG: hypothetical protein ACPGAC_09380, partial [Candidatus Puniceispirillaceae bacterium]